MRRHVGYVVAMWVAYERYRFPIEDMGCTREVSPAHERYGLPIEDMNAFGRYGLPMEDVGCTRLCWTCEVAIWVAWVLNKVMVSYTNKAMRG